MPTDSAAYVTYPYTPSERIRCLKAETPASSEKLKILTLKAFERNLQLLNLIRNSIKEKVKEHEVESPVNDKVDKQTSTLLLLEVSKEEPMLQAANKQRKQYKPHHPQPNRKLTRSRNASPVREFAKFQARNHLMQLLSETSLPNDLSLHLSDDSSDECIDLDLSSNTKLTLPEQKVHHSHIFNKAQSLSHL